MCSLERSSGVLNLVVSAIYLFRYYYWRIMKRYFESRAAPRLHPWVWWVQCGCSWVQRNLHGTKSTAENFSCAISLHKYIVQLCTIVRGKVEDNRKYSRHQRRWCQPIVVCALSFCIQYFDLPIPLMVSQSLSQGSTFHVEKQQWRFSICTHQHHRPTSESNLIIDPSRSEFLVRGPLDDSIIRFGIFTDMLIFERRSRNGHRSWRVPLTFSPKPWDILRKRFAKCNIRSLRC